MELNLFRDIKLRGYFLKVVGTILFFIILTVILMVSLGKQALDGIDNIIPLGINLVVLIITLNELKRNNISVRNVVGKPKNKSFIFEVPISLILTYVAGVGMILILLYIVYRINPNITQEFNNGLAEKHEKAATFLTMTIDFIDVVLLAPILEEIIFRGILLGKLYSKYGVVRAIFLTSGIFFMIHFKTNPMTFILGITNCILVLKYKSLIPGMLCHGLNNLFVLLRIMGSKGNNPNSGPLEVNIVILITGIIMLSIYALYVYRNRSYIKTTKVSERNLTGSV